MDTSQYLGIDAPCPTYGLALKFRVPVDDAPLSVTVRCPKCSTKGKSALVTVDVATASLR